jgi:hypothetical protein
MSKGFAYSECVMKSIVSALVLMGLALGLAGCKDAPGADGRYATHDRGHLNRGP